jgi:hypothetical protein
LIKLTPEKNNPKRGMIHGGKNFEKDVEGIEGT